MTALWDRKTYWDAAISWDTMSTETYFFEPPIAYDLPPTLPPLNRRINSHAKWKPGQRRGRSVLKTAGVFTTVDVPTVDQTNAADEYYAGGHIYEINVLQAADLLAAGYNILLGLSGYILIEATTDFLVTESWEPITDESDDPLGWDTLQTIPPIVDGVLLDESGNRLISEYV